ncbi:MAG: DUF488 domain-containing protein [Candidatus Promineifilaceae bacterium]|nr:DUF488 domain-containing protein [Candidatus Promineifilaceae bacterium]
MTQQPIYTIGHGGRDLDDFIALLGRHHIAYLIDVRSQPYSRYQPAFNKDPLQSRLKDAGIRYLFMGDSLGGRPDDPAAYREGKVDYDQLQELDAYQAGLERLEAAQRQGHRVVLLCSERKPENCHRSKLIGRSLTERDVDVRHIDEQDTLLSQEEIYLRIIGGQPSLFGDDFHRLTSRQRYGSAEDEADQDDDA